jgi:hypothetical protein
MAQSRHYAVGISVDSTWLLDVAQMQRSGGNTVVNCLYLI